MADEKPTTVAATEAPSAADEIQPPPALKKPSRDAVKEVEDKLRAEMQVIDDKIKVVSDKAKKLSQASAGKDDGVSEARSKLKELKGKRETLIAQRTAIYGARDAARETRDAKMSEMKDLKSQTKFKSTSEIDRKVKALETAQNTTSMTLAKEKETLKEIAELKKERAALAKTEAVAAELDGTKAAGVDNGAAIKDISEQLNKIKGEMDTLNEVMNKHYEKSKDSAYPALMKEKDALRAEKGEKQTKLQKLWDDFKEDNKVWKDNQAEWDKYKKVRAVAQAQEYEARKAEKAQKRAEELAKKTPYEEEMALCDYLVNYLSTTFLGSEDKAKADAAAAAAAAGAAAQLDGAFAGMTMLKSAKGGDQDYMAATGKKGPKKSGGKKAVAGTKRGKIVIFPETLESFGLLKMAPPTSVEGVADCVAALEAKKAAFAVMPRGQVVSIAELNLKFEEDADARPRYADDKAKPSGDGKPKAAAKGGSASGKKIDVTSTELFPSLGGPKKVAAAEEEEKK